MSSDFERHFLDDRLYREPVSLCRSQVRRAYVNRGGEPSANGRTLIDAIRADPTLADESCVTLERDAAEYETWAEKYQSERLIAECRNTAKFKRDCAANIRELSKGAPA